MIGLNNIVFKTINVIGPDLRIENVSLTFYSAERFFFGSLIKASKSLEVRMGLT